jgi:S1-C subfamily serine protease
MICIGDIMKKHFVIIFVVVLSFALLLGCTSANIFLGGKHKANFSSQQIDTSAIKNYQDLVSVCKPAVVGIASLGKNFQSIGTGVCINNQSYILTNNHVVQDGDIINLYLSNGDTTNAKIVWTDASSDLAILKAQTSVPYLSLAKAGSYKSGDDVVAIGTPLDLAFKHSATKGIISAVNRTIKVDNDKGQSTLYNLIQHDASINPGNSGGPLINMQGQIIGINTVKVTDAEGMSFAIPVDTFAPVITKVSANGSYDTTYLGVFGYDNGLNHIGSKASGYYIKMVASNSPASKIGLKSGDIITAVDEQAINLARDLKIALYNHQVGDKITLTISSEGKTKNVTIALTKHPYCFCATKVLTNREV